MTMPTKTRFAGGLYGVTPDWDDAARLEAAVRQAAAGGMTALQLRLKTVNPALKLSIAARLREICTELGVVYIVNDDWRLARDSRADGVHLGRDDGDPSQVRDQIGADMLIGVSCYADIARAESMLDVPVDYIAFGAMYPSGTKPGAPPANLDVLRLARDLTTTRSHGLVSGRPAVVAIGGITPHNARALVQAGADSVAVVGALFGAPDITSVAQQFTQLFRDQADPALS